MACRGVLHGLPLKLTLVLILAWFSVPSCSGDPCQDVVLKSKGLRPTSLVTLVISFKQFC